MGSNGFRILAMLKKLDLLCPGRRSALQSLVKPVSLPAVVNWQLKSCLERPYICTLVSDAPITIPGLTIPLEMASSNPSLPQTTAPPDATLYAAHSLVRSVHC